MLVLGPHVDLQGNERVGKVVQSLSDRRVSDDLEAVEVALCLEDLLSTIDVSIGERQHATHHAFAEWRRAAARIGVSTEDADIEITES